MTFTVVAEHLVECQQRYHVCDDCRGLSRVVSKSAGIEGGFASLGEGLESLCLVRLPPRGVAISRVRGVFQHEESPVLVCHHRQYQLAEE